MSAGKLLRAGYSWYGKGETLYIYDEDDNVILTGSLTKDNLIKLNLKRKTVPCAKVTVEDQLVIKRWHNKIGHINFQKLNELSKVYELNLPDARSFKCEPCLLAKIESWPFPISQSVSSDILELIQSDVSGIVRIENDLDVSYFVTFMCHYSKMSFVYLMKRKSEVYDTFIRFKQWIEKQTGKQIKCLRTDQGGEYVNGNFDKLKDETGLDYQRSIARRQQQNGGSEKLGKDLTYMGRTMLIGANLSVRFWPLAVLAANYVRVRVPCITIDNDVPYRKFFGHLPDIYFLERFGADVVVKKDVHSNKYDARGEKGIMVGYARGVKAHLIYLYSSGRIIESRDWDYCDSAEVINKTDRPPKFAWNGEIEFTEVNDELELDMTDDFVSTDAPSKADDLCFDGDLRINLQSFTNSESDRMITGVSDIRPAAPLNRSVYFECDDDQLSVDEHEPTERAGDGELSESAGPQLISLNKKQLAEFKIANPSTNLKYVKCIPGERNEKRREYLICSVKTPTSFQQATASRDAEHWNEAMLSEYTSHQMNKTWEVVDRKTGMKVIPGIWLFRVKYNDDLTVDKYKARYVALGNRLEDIEKNEKYAPVLRSSSMNVIFALCEQFDLIPHHVDVTTAFLYGELLEEIYLTQPPGFIDPNKPNGVCRLIKAIYGLPQAGKKFHEFITSLMKQFDLIQLLSDQCLFISKNGDLLIGIYVDDCVVCGKTIELIDKFKAWLGSKCKITDKGELKHCLSLNVRREPDAIWVNQATFIREFLTKFEFDKLKPVNTPMILDLKLDDELDKPIEDHTWYRSVLGALLYLAEKSRPDVCFAVTRLCRYMHNPRQTHVTALKRIVRYLIGTIDLSLKFTKGQSDIVCYTDADFGNDVLSGKSVSGTMVYLFGNLVHWQCKRQHFVALSTCESEVLAIREGVAMVIYLRNLINELGFGDSLNSVPIIYNDNQSAIATLVDGGSFQRNKHYQLRISFIRDHIKRKDVRVMFKAGNLMLADFLTKPLAYTLFSGLTSKCGLCVPK